MVNKSKLVQKEDLRKEYVECVRNITTKTCVNNNPLLRFVNYSKTIDD